MLIATFVHPTGIFGIGFRVARDPADESGKFRLPHAVHIDDRLKDPHRSLGTVARVTFLSPNVDQIVAIHSAAAHARSPSARETGNEERSAWSETSRPLARILIIWANFYRKMEIRCRAGFPFFAGSRANCTTDLRFVFLEILDQRISKWRGWRKWSNKNGTLWLESWASVTSADCPSALLKKSREVCGSGLEQSCSQEKWNFF